MNNNYEQLFEDNKNLIWFVIKKYFPHIYNDWNNPDREDYYQIGSIGLLKAIHNYNESMSCFSTYAVPMIWGEIKRYCRDNTSIKYSRKIIDICSSILSSVNFDKEDALFQINELIDDLDISDYEKLAVRTYYIANQSLDEIIFDNNKEDHQVSLADMIPSSINVIDDVVYEDYINKIFENESERTKLCMQMMLDGKTQNEIVEILGNEISQAQVSRILRKLKIKMINCFIDSEEYDIALKCINKLFNPKNLDNLIGIGKTYRLKIYKIPKSILINYFKESEQNMNNSTTYSKKSCQRLITKCIMKLILSNKHEINDICKFKQRIINLLKQNDYDSECIFNHLNAQSISQINSLIDYANKLITKYQYKREYEILINEDELQLSKIKKVTKTFDKENFKSITTTKDIKSSIITLLEVLKQNNLASQF